MICNGDTLIDAIEDGYLFEEFVEHVMSGGLSRSSQSRDSLFEQFCEKMRNGGFA
jgi:hypothetical protein